MKLTPFRMQNGLPSGQTSQAREARGKAEDLIGRIENFGERYTGTASQTVSHGTEVDYETVTDKVHGDELADNTPERSQVFDGVSAYNFNISSGTEYRYIREGSHEMFSRATHREKVTVMRDHATGTIALIEE